jgi:sensor histidine kinase YesM
VVSILALFIDPPALAANTLVALLTVAGVSIVLNRVVSHPRNPLSVGFLGGASQACAVLACDLVIPLLRLPHPMSLAVISIPANAFGLFLAMLVLRDADTRAKSERNRIDLERSRVLLVSADLTALRARIRPHFLFNTLSAIASLCTTDPKQAEASILKLGSLMRRTLEVQTTSVTMLAMELEYVKAYVHIQTLRFGERIETTFAIDPNVLGADLPAFSLQTLVENAYQHAFDGHPGPGFIQIRCRLANSFVLISVADNGVGMDAAFQHRVIDESDPPKHGMGIIDRQMRLLYGPHSRLRMFSRADEGTLVAFRVPLGDSGEAHGTL